MNEKQKSEMYLLNKPPKIDVQPGPDHDPVRQTVITMHDLHCFVSLAVRLD